MYGSWAQAKSPVWAEPDFCPVQEAQSSCPAQFGRSLKHTTPFLFLFMKKLSWELNIPTAVKYQWCRVPPRSNIVPQKESIFWHIDFGLWRILILKTKLNIVPCLVWRRLSFLKRFLSFLGHFCSLLHFLTAPNVRIFDAFKVGLVTCFRLSKEHIVNQFNIPITNKQ